MHIYNNFINGSWVEAISGDVLDVIDPANLEPIAQVANGGFKDAQRCVDAAAEAFKNWSKTTAYERSDLLKAWSREIEQNHEALAQCITQEQGKPLAEARGEMNYANGYVMWYAEEAKRIYGDTIPASAPNKRIIVTRQAIGVVAIITPWNFPAAMLARKIAPALAAGCTVVIKPAELTPITAIKLIEAAEKAGLPKGVINLVTGDPQEIGQAWLKDSRVRKMSFTGSTPVGKYLIRESADTVKKLSLELGGHAPFIIAADADVDKAVRGVMDSKFRNAGQTCICSNRIYVHESIEADFLEKLSAAIGQLTVGNGSDKGVDVGPLINEKALLKVSDHLKDAKEKGATVICGGHKVEKLKGYYFEPTLISNVSSAMRCTQEETFGPLAPVESFTSEEEVIERANNTPFGLAAYVYSENLSCCIRMAEALDYGIIGVNDGLPSTPQAPFGGVKESGYGREGGYYGLEEYLTVKMISLAI